MEIAESTRRSYKEVYRIIENSTEDIQNKIPTQFKNFLKSSMLDNYEPTIDYGSDLLSQNLMEETYTVMAIIYRDYLCSSEERAQLIAEEKAERIRIEEEKREKYNPDNIFKKEEPKVTTSNITNTVNNANTIDSTVSNIESNSIASNVAVDSTTTKDMTVVKEPGFFGKIINKIKNFFFKK